LSCPAVVVSRRQSTNPSSPRSLFFRRRWRLVGWGGEGFIKNERTHAVSAAYTTVRGTFFTFHVSVRDRNPESKYGFTDSRAVRSAESKTFSYQTSVRFSAEWYAFLIFVRTTSSVVVRPRVSDLTISSGRRSGATSNMKTNQCSRHVRMPSRGHRVGYEHDGELPLAFVRWPSRWPSTLNEDGTADWCFWVGSMRSMTNGGRLFDIATVHRRRAWPGSAVMRKSLERRRDPAGLRYYRYCFD